MMVWGHFLTPKYSQVVGIVVMCGIGVVFHGVLYLWDLVCHCIDGVVVHKVTAIIVKIIKIIKIKIIKIEIIKIKIIKIIKIKIKPTHLF